MNRAFHVVAVLLAAVLIAAGLWVLGVRAQVPPQPMGDQLGPETGETAGEYAERAQTTLTDSQEKAFALVAFDEPLSAQDASDTLAPVLRVSSLVVEDRAPIPVGEPAQLTSAPVDRAAIFHTAWPGSVVGAVVWDQGNALRRLAGHPAIRTVEMLPPDAVWGTFGVRPVGLAQ